MENTGCGAWEITFLGESEMKHSFMMVAILMATATVGLSDEPVVVQRQLELEAFKKEAAELEKAAGKLESEIRKAEEEKKEAENELADAKSNLSKAETEEQDAKGKETAAKKVRDDAEIAATNAAKEVANAPPANRPEARKKLKEATLLLEAEDKNLEKAEELANKALRELIRLKNAIKAAQDKIQAATAKLKPDLLQKAKDAQKVFESYRDTKLKKAQDTLLQAQLEEKARNDSATAAEKSTEVAKVLVKDGKVNPEVAEAIAALLMSKLSDSKDSEAMMRRVIKDELKGLLTKEVLEAALKKVETEVKGARADINEVKGIAEKGTDAAIRVERGIEDIKTLVATYSDGVKALLQDSKRHGLSQEQSEDIERKTRLWISEALLAAFNGGNNAAKKLQQIDARFKGLEMWIKNIDLRKADALTAESCEKFATGEIYGGHLGVKSVQIPLKSTPTPRPQP